jgi:L,D-transpeptidase ErfK/SrfK
MKTSGYAVNLAFFLVSVLAMAVARPAAATQFTITDPAQNVYGADQTVQTRYEDTLYDLARRYSLGSEELIRVNPGVNPWLPGAGTSIIVPGRMILPNVPREGIVVNLSEHRLYYFPKMPKAAPAKGKGKGKAAPGPVPQIVYTFPVSIGKMDWRTPIGVTQVIGKQKDPVWRPTESVRAEHRAQGDILPAVVPAGPDNPLGLYAMRLAAGNGTYMIHGTNNPIAVGLAVTHGCIRMYPEDVEALFPLVPVGTPVRIIDEPVKVAWVNGELLLEAHPPINAVGETIEPDVDTFSALLQKAVGDTTVAIHWDYAREVLQRADGVLATVGLEADVPGGLPAPDAAPGSAPVTTDAPPLALGNTPPAVMVDTGLKR